MNHKLATIGVLFAISTMNATTVKNRLKEEIAKTEEQKKAAFDEYQSLENTLAFRASVLRDIMHCMETENSDDQDAEYQCYCKTAQDIELSIKDGNISDKKELEMVKEQLRIIRDKDLRKSWLWWL